MDYLAFLTPDVLDAISAAIGFFSVGFIAVGLVAVAIGMASD